MQLSPPKPFFAGLCLVSILTAGSALHAQAANPWFSEVIASAPTKLGGCAIGDVDPEHEGNEIVAVAEDGKVYLSRSTGRRWVTAVIAQAEGELLQCAIGDVDPELPGEELVVVGMKKGKEDAGGAGVAYLLSSTERDGGKWRLRPLFETEALIHAVCILDLDHNSPGSEIVLGGFDQVLWVLSSTGTSLSAVAGFEGAIKSIHGYSNHGTGAGPRGVAVACADGKLIHVFEAQGAWQLRVLQDAPTGQARLGGQEGLVWARDDGKLFHAGPGDAIRGREIYSEKNKLRGAVLADLDPAWPGQEAATVGYLGRMTVLYHEEGRWFSETVHTDSDRFHHLAVGEVDATSPGPELVGCGYSGHLILAGVRGE